MMLRTGWWLIALCMGVAGTSWSGENTDYVWRVDGFEQGFAIDSWQSSQSPEYYQGGAGQVGLECVQDPERGEVLRCAFRFSDPAKSEPVFFTRALDPQPGRMDVLGVRFKAKLTAPVIASRGGFILRLRTSDTQHDNWDVQKEVGREFPVGEWVTVEIKTGLGPNVRNVWNSAFGNIRQMTFRLDDIDALDGDGALLLDDIEMVLAVPPALQPYVAQASVRSDNAVPRVLVMAHRAAGFYGIEAALRQVAPQARVTTLYYRGLHFGFFGFPATRDDVLTYDGIIMLNIDPFVLTRLQAEWVADAVASGSGLLVFGGSVTLTQARDYRQALRSVLPVTFAPGTSILGGGVPEAGPPHPLNRGFDPTGLGTAWGLQALTPIGGAAVPWRVGDQPLVVTAPMGRGRTTVVNAQLQMDRCFGGDWFTSPLSDDMMRNLVSWTLGQDLGKGFASLSVPDAIVGSGMARFEAVTADPTSMSVRIFQGVERTPVETEHGPDGKVTAAISVSASPRDRTVPVRLELHHGDVLECWRDVDLSVLNPLKIEGTWPAYRSTFAPGGTVELEVTAGLRGMPRVTVGARVSAEYEPGWVVGVDSFADVWVTRDGASFHDLGGPADVVVTPLLADLPAWAVSGTLRASRPNEGTHLGDDGNLAKVKRTVTTRVDGTVDILTAYEFVMAAGIQRLPLTLSFPVSRFAGLAYEVTYEDGTRARGTFPREMEQATLFDGIGCTLRIETPNGPLELAVTSPGRRVWARDLRHHDMSSFRLEVEAPCTNTSVKPGESYAVGIRLHGPGISPALAPVPDDLVFEVDLVDARSAARWPVPLCSVQGWNAHFSGVLPNLLSGSYTAEIRALSAGNILAQKGLPCAVVDPLDRRWFFPIMSIIGIQADGHCLDQDGIHGRIAELIAHGFNTAAITGASSFLDDHQSTMDHLKAYSEQLAQQSGMATTFEYSSFTTYRRDGALNPCPFGDHLAEGVENYLAPRIEVGNQTPRLLSAKVVDEPSVRPESLDGCPACLVAFRERYGFEYGAIADDAPPYQRWALADFLGYAVDRVFAEGARVAAAREARFDLLLTYMATGLGYQKPRLYQQDASSWSRHVKRADFDIYPYFYPQSQHLRMVQAGFGLSAMKDIARARAIPWGFYVELDDRNWPFQQNPRQASAECAYTAVAHGADYLNTFIHRVVGTGTQARPERWEDAGRAFRLIRRCGPLLTVMPALRASLALYYPDAQEFIDNGYARPEYTVSMLKGTYGDVDVHREEIVTETGTIPYASLVLLRTVYLHEAAVPVLKTWLHEGGVLVSDALPTTTHRGEPIDWGPMAPETVAFGCGECTLHVRPIRVGKGTVVLLKEDIETLFETHIEADSPTAYQAVWDLRQAFGQVLGAFAPSPSIRVTYREGEESVDTIEAGLRGNEHAIFVTVVNHQPETQQVDVEVRRPDIRWLVDMQSLQPVEIPSRSAAGFRLRLSVPRRGARLIAGYRSRPRGVRVAVDHGTVAPGEVLSYTATVKGRLFSDVAGGVLVDARVIGPDGEGVSRFSKAMAPLSGSATIVCDMPLNALPGTYRIEAVLPQTGQSASTSFVVLPSEP